MAEGAKSLSSVEIIDDEDWRSVVEAELAATLRAELNALGLQGRLFISRSKGRGRRRAEPKPVLLVGYESRWHMIHEEKDAAGERTPWDEIAQERGFGSRGWLGNGGWPGDELRSAAIRALRSVGSF